MANTSILLKRSGLTGITPSSLNFGELALNYYDGKIYYKNASSVITSIGSVNSFANINANSTLILASSGSDTLALTANNGVSVVGNSSSKSINIALISSGTSGNVLTSTGSSWVSSAPSGGGAGAGSIANSARLVYTATSGQTLFATPPYIPGAAQLSVYISGVKQYPADYAETSNTSVTLVTGAVLNDTVLVEVNGYVSYNSVGTWVSTPAVYLNTFTGNGSATTYTLAQTPIIPSNIVLSIDGITQLQSAYSLTGNTVTFTSAPDNGATIEGRVFGSGAIYANTIAGAVVLVSSSTCLSSTTGTLVVNNGVGVTGNVWADGVYSNGVVRGTTLVSNVSTGTAPFIVTSTTPVANLNVGGNAAGLSATLAIASGGTNSTATPTAGGAGYGTGTAHAYTAAGTAGQVFTSAGAGAPSWATPSPGTTISGGTTGLTPASATSGTVTLGGTLVASNGGTGVATLTGLVYGNGTAAMSAATAAQVVGVIGATAVTNATNSTACSGLAASATLCNGNYNTTNAQNNGTDGWWRSTGSAGWYSTSFGVGIYATETTNVRTYNGANFIAAGNVTAYSDIRLKENVKTIPNALEKVQAIRGVTFTRNDMEDTEKVHTGVIAQEVLAVFPEAVMLAREDDFYTVAYGNMVGLLIEAIKEQQSIITNLSNRLDALESK